MIARNGRKRQPHGRQQALQVLIFLRRRGVHQIAGYHHEVGRRGKLIERCDAPLKRLCRIDATIGERARLLDVEVRDVRYADGLVRHFESSGGNSRTASGATSNPIRSPGFTCTVFGASTLSGRSETPPTVIRCRSPVKLTLSMTPD